MSYCGDSSYAAIWINVNEYFIQTPAPPVNINWIPSIPASENYDFVIYRNHNLERGNIMYTGWVKPGIFQEARPVYNPWSGAISGYWVGFSSDGETLTDEIFTVALGEIVIVNHQGTITPESDDGYLKITDSNGEIFSQYFSHKPEWGVKCSKDCPPNTCKCECPVGSGHYCCYDDNGEKVYEFQE
jgi:hypothetical protein